MAHDIYKGWDCCKSYPHPRTPVRIYPETTTAKPNTSIILEAKNIHGDCDPGCFEWKLLQGTGKLVGDFGDTNLYETPDVDKECKNGAIIALICGKKPISLAYIGVSDVDNRSIAYRIAFFRPDRYYAPIDRNWPPLDPQPSGLHRHHYKYMIVFWWMNYDCMDRFINKSFHSQFPFLWKWDPRKENWYLYAPEPHMLDAVVESESEIPTTRIEKYFPVMNEKRSGSQKRKGCCPAGMIKYQDYLAVGDWR